MNTYIIGSHMLEFAVSWTEKHSPWCGRNDRPAPSRMKKQKNVGYFLRIDRKRVYRIVRPSDFVTVQEAVAKLRRGNTAGLDDYLKETLSERDRFVREANN